MVRLWAHAGLVDLAHWLDFAWVLTFVFRSWASWRFLLNFNLAASVAVGLIAISQRLDFLVLGYVGPFERLESTLVNPSYTGAYLVMNVFVAMGFLGWSLLREGDRPTPSRHAWLWPVGLWRMFWTSTALLDVTVLYLGGSRGPWSAFWRACCSSARATWHGEGTAVSGRSRWPLSGWRPWWYW